MKRVLSLIVSVLFCTGLFAQTLDTLDYPVTNATGYTLSGAPGGGSVTGGNIYTAEIGQRFTHSGGTVIGIEAWIGRLDIIGGADNFTFKVYNTSNGLPTGAPIATQTVSASNLNAATNFAAGYNLISFNVPPTVSGEFVIAVDVDLTTKNDSIGFVTNAFGDGQADSNSLMKLLPSYGGNWIPMDEWWLSWDRDIIMYPIVQRSASTLSMDLTEVRCGNYTSYPLSQVQQITFGADVDNSGSVAAQLVSATITITELGSNTQVYNQSIGNLNVLLPAPIPAGAQSSQDIPQALAFYTPSDTGVYEVEFELEYGASPFTSGDPTQITSNSYYFLVNDSVYARDEFALFAQAFEAVGIGSSNGSGVGQVFNVVSSDTLTSVTFAYSGDTSLWVGQNLQVNVYNYSGSGPGSLIASSNTYTIPDDSSRFVNVDFASNPLILNSGQYFVGVNNAPYVGYSDRIVADNDVYVQTTNGGPWSLLDTITAGAFPGSFMIRPNFGSQPQPQQPSGTCDTLTNVGANDTLTIWGSTAGGAVSGHSGDGFTRFAEKFTSPYATSDINNVSFYFGDAQTLNPGTASINVRIWEDDGGPDAFGVPNSPGSIVASQTVLISDIVNDVNNNLLTTVTFGTTPVVSGDFYVGYEITYANGDSVALVTNRSESVPATFSVGLPGVWGRIDSVYGINVSGVVFADICESTTQPAPVVNFTGEPLTLLEGNDVQFTDLSTNTPTSWTWTFQGGTPGGSSQQNPVITYNTAGTYDVSLSVSNSGGSDAGTAADFVTVLQWPSLPACDTVSNIDLSSDNLLNGRSTSAGYIAGHNNFGDLSKADKFSGFTAGDQISGVALGFAVAQGTGSVSVNVWDNTGAGGTPGATPIASETISIPTLVADVFTNSLTYVSFTNPVTVTAGTEYYIGISYTYAAGDTVSLYHSNDGEAPINTAWEQWSNGDWYPYSDDVDSWGIDVAHLITPLVCSSCPTIGTNVTTTDASCGNSDGTATVTPNGGVSPYTYEWSDNQTTPTATGLAAGTYTVTVFDANNCSATATANVSDSGSPNVALDSKGDVSCNGASDGFISVVVSGGTPNYTYTWNVPGNTATLTNLSAGTYNLTVEDANGCSQTFSETISEPTVLTASVASSSNLSCASVNDGSINISVSGGTTPYTYNWSNSATTQNLSSLAAGTYTVTVEDNNGCTATTSATISNPANPLTVSVNNAQTSSCGVNDATLTANASGGAGGYSYSWTGSGSTTMTASNLGAGSYTVTVTDASNCTATTTATVSDPGALSVSVNTTNVSCNGLSDGTASAQVAGGSGSQSYAWSVGGSSSTVTGLAPGQVTVTVTDAGCTAVASGAITEPTAINVSVTQTDVTCNGGSNGTATAFVTGGAGNYTYQWLTNPIQGGQSVTGLEAGNIILNVTDGSNCQAAPVTVTINQPSDISASISSTPVTCYGDDDGSAQLSVSGGTAPYSYNWAVGGSSSLLNGVEAGTYSVTVSDINNCQKVLSATVGGPDSIAIQTGTVDNVTCNGLSDGSISLNVSGGNGGFSYSWSNNQTTSSASLSNVSAGNYFVTATDANGCSKVSSSVSVTQPQPLTLSSSQDNVTCALGSDGEASVVPAGGTSPYTYSWTSSNNTTGTEAGLSAGPVTVNVTDANGCTNSSSFTIADGVSPGVTTAGTDATGTDDNGTATADVTGGASPYTYEWSDDDAQTTATATGLTDDTYTVTVTDANGCASTSTVTIGRTTSIGNIADLETLNIFPNPTSGTVNLKLELGSTAEVQIEWVNVLGSRVAAEYVGNTLTVNRSYDLGAFAAGIYFAKIRIDNELIVRKVIVSKQ